MSSIHKICTIDGLGRIVIPVGVRRELSLSKNDSLELSCENGSIVLKKLRNNCVFCNSEDKLQEYKGKHICKLCLDSLLSK